MAKYRHYHTGATRESKTELGWPYVPADQTDAEALAPESMTKADLQSVAEAMQIETTGTKSELIDRINAARAAESEAQ